MASGNLSLLITEDVTWESFPEQADRFVKLFKGIVLIKVYRWGRANVDRAHQVVPLFLTIIS